jgi:N-carbamoyl-L-amino-acid hydrolase
MTPQTVVADHVDGDRLWRSILEMAKIGATPGGGSHRIAFSREDDDGRTLFKSWCEDAGLSVANDAFGNMYATRRGCRELEPLMIGSHLDTQPRGGRFDGVLGVLGGLEIVRALNDAGVETERPIVLVNWTNEEGAVLTPMMGSAVFTGTLSLSEALGSRLPQGHTVAEALATMKCGSGETRMDSSVHAYLELHIEQGPILENEGLSIGVVSGGIGFRRYGIRFEGQEAHAGPTPMTSRKDPMVAAAQAIAFADELARRDAGARATVGTFKLNGGSPNTVASEAEFTLDIRHAEAAAIDQMEASILAEITQIASRSGTQASHAVIANSPPAPFDPGICSIVENATRQSGYSYRTLPSGAGHDACNMSRKIPTGMIFVPSQGGISHNEIEFTSKADCLAGARVLAHTVAVLTSQSSSWHPALGNAR